MEPIGIPPNPRNLLVEQLTSSGHPKGRPVSEHLSVRNQIGIQRNQLCVCMMPKARVWDFPINLEDRTKEIKGLYKLVQSNGNAAIA